MKSKGKKKAGVGLQEVGGFGSSPLQTQLWSYFPPAPHPPEQRLLGFDLSFQLRLNELCSLLPQTQSGRAGPPPPPPPLPRLPATVGKEDAMKHLDTLKKYVEQCLICT